MEAFRELGILEPILDTIKEERFSEPSEIQRKAVPLILQGKDVIAGSATGSGKTLAFAAGIIQNADRGRGIQALVIVPTRELCEQVSIVLKKYSKYKELSIVTIYGGVSISPQIKQLEYADIAVGTPGRILDHLKRQTLNLQDVKHLVLDEADRMLDMGFVHDVVKIIDSCPEERQTLFFSATMSDEVFYLAQKYMKNPVEISAEVYVDKSKMKQVYYDVPENLKFSLLVNLLASENKSLSMIFCNTRATTDFISKNLRLNRINAEAIHGGLSQERRNSIIRAFHSGKIGVLVCTDVAARGLDIKNVGNIFNYNIPKDPNDYIHRIGRTARAGESGKVINLLVERDYDNFRKILENEELIIEEENVSYIPRVMIRWIPRPKHESRGYRNMNRGRDYRRR